MKKEITENLTKDQKLKLDPCIIKLVKLIEKQSIKSGPFFKVHDTENKKGLLISIKDQSLNNDSITFVSITSTIENSVNLKTYLTKNDKILNTTEADFVAYENLLEQLIILMNDVSI